MDKDCLIIFLILILIIALLNKKNENKYTKTFQKYYKGITNDLENRFNKESFNNVDNRNRQVLPWVQSNNSNISSELDSEFVTDINTRPNQVTVLANSGDNKITINSINGYQIGDVISINPGKNNAESKTVVGIGNGIIGLDSTLIYQHKPNETIYNMSNPDVNYNKNKNTNEKESRYAYINNQGKLDYSPTQETWDIPRGSVEQWGSCNISQQCQDGYECRVGGYTNKGRCLTEQDCQYSNWLDGITSKTNCSPLYQPYQSANLPMPTRNIQQAQANRESQNS